MAEAVGQPKPCERGVVAYATERKSHGSRVPSPRLSFGAGAGADAPKIVAGMLLRRLGWMRIQRKCEAAREPDPGQGIRNSYVGQRSGTSGGQIPAGHTW